jgi:hypothetical protein
MTDANNKADATSESLRRTVFQMERLARLTAEAQALFFRNCGLSMAEAAALPPPTRRSLEARWQVSSEYAKLLHRIDDPTDQPCATDGKLSFRYKSPNGQIVVLGAADANEARAAVQAHFYPGSEPRFVKFMGRAVQLADLEQWDWGVKAYVPCTVPKANPQPKE